MLAAILYVLRTGTQWNALSRELGASTTVYDRFRRMASSKGCLIISGKRACKNMTNWKRLPGNGKACMG
jgi:transposase